MKTISSFREKPKLKITWAAVITAALSLLFLIAAVVIMNTVVSSQNLASSAPAWLEAVFDIGCASVAAGLLSLGLSFNALTKGERSWAAFTALAASIISLIAWAVIIL